MPNLKLTFYKTGWRPAIGWVCVLALFLQYFLSPFLSWAALLCGYNIPFPSVTDTNFLLTVLGLAGLRTTEKLKGKENDLS